jgi:hypothetical protein
MLYDFVLKLLLYRELNIRNQIFSFLYLKYIEDLDNENPYLLSQFDLLNIDFFYDYLCFIENWNWYSNLSPNLLDFSDIFCLLNYNKNWRLNIIVKKLGYSSDFGCGFEIIPLVDINEAKKKYKISDNNELFYKIYNDMKLEGHFYYISISKKDIPFFLYILGTTKGRLIFI